MKTLGIAIGVGILLVPQGCSVKGKPRLTDIVTESVMEDSISDMIDFIGYVDSAHLVEEVSESYTKMEEKNEELETQLEKTKQELGVVKHDLELAEKVIETYVPADTASSNFKLLPISKADSNK
jgi:hypothetical protein